MQQRSGSAKLRVRPHESVHEGAATDRHHGQARSVHLPVQFIQAIEHHVGQLIRMQLRATIRRSADFTGKLCAVAFHLRCRGVVKQRTHRRTSNVEADDKRTCGWRSQLLVYITIRPMQSRGAGKVAGPVLCIVYPLADARGSGPQNRAR